MLVTLALIYEHCNQLYFARISSSSVEDFLLTVSKMALQR